MPKQSPAAPAATDPHPINILVSTGVLCISPTSSYNDRLELAHVLLDSVGKCLFNFPDAENHVLQEELPYALAYLLAISQELIGSVNLLKAGA